MIISTNLSWLTVSSFPMKSHLKEHIPQRSTNLFQCLILDPPWSMSARRTRYFKNAWKPSLSRSIRCSAWCSSTLCDRPGKGRFRRNSYWTLNFDEIFCTALMWKIVKMPIADWLPYPLPLYINIGFGLRLWVTLSR